MPSSGGNGWLPTFMGMAGMRQGGNESTVRETWQHSIHTKFVVPLAQVVGCVLCGLGCIASLFLLWYTLESAHGNPKWLLFGFLSTPIIFIPCAAGCYNLIKDLTVPFWRKSPAEQIMLPPMARYMDALAMEHEQRVGGLVRLSARSAGELKAILSSEKDKDNPDRIPPEVADLVDFILVARQRGLSRPKWIPANGPRVALPTTGHIVQRQLYDQMIDELVGWGFIERGKDGLSHRWLVKPTDALRRIGMAIYTN